MFILVISFIASQLQWIGLYNTISFSEGEDSHCSVVVLTKIFT